MHVHGGHDERRQGMTEGKRIQVDKRAPQASEARYAETFDFRTSRFPMTIELIKPKLRAPYMRRRGRADMGAAPKCLDCANRLYEVHKNGVTTC